MKLSETCGVLDVIVIDSMYIGNMAFPEAFSRKIIGIVSPLPDIPTSGQEYIDQSRGLLNMYTPEDIADMSDITYATDRGSLRL